MAAIYHAEIPVDLAGASRERPLPVQFFRGDNDSHIFTAWVGDSANPEAGLLAGTVAGTALRGDGVTVPLSGEKGSATVPVTFNGITVQATPCRVTLPQAAFRIPGMIKVSILLTDGGITTTVLSLSGSVVQTNTDAVTDPEELIPNLSALQTAAAQAIAAAEDAETAAESVPALVAPTFDTTTAYAAGDYVYYNGSIYRFTAAHAAGAWTGSDAVQTTVTDEYSDLKSAIDVVENKGENPAPSGKFWMSTWEGAEWSDPIEHGLPAFEKTISDLATGYYWDVSNGVAVKTEGSQSLYNSSLWDVSAYRGKTVEIVCNTINTGSGRKSGICDAEGNVSASESEDNFVLGEDGKYHKTFSVNEDYLFISVSSYPHKDSVDVHIDGDPDTSIFYMAEQGEALEERMDVADNSGDNPVPAGKVWTSTENGAEWQTPSGSGLSVIPTPTGFGWENNPLEGHLFRSEAGITTDFDVAQYRPTGKTYWVAPNGDDSNSGEDADHPLQLIKTALNKPDVDVVILKNGFYNYGRLPQHLNGYSRSVAIIAAEGATPVLGTQEGTSGWTKSDGYTYVYEAAFASNCVYDTQYCIAYQRLLTIEDVEATPASYCSMNSKTYVHTKNGDAATGTYIKPCKNYDNFRITASGEITIYIEGITICGGGYGAFRVTSDGTNPVTVYAKNCRFFGSISNAACYLEGCYSILQNCEAGYAGDDGFGYHAKTVIPRAIEINCIGHHNGLEGATDNGSTMHDGGSIIRVSGEYHHNRGPNVADVHNNTTSWNLGCHAWKADISGQTTQNADFVCSDSGANMWLDNCSAFGSYYSLLANSTGSVYERGNAFVTRYVGENCALYSY